MKASINYDRIFRNRGFVFCVVMLALQTQATADRHNAQTDAQLSGIRYFIELAIDYRNAEFSGVETVRFTNSGREEIEHLNFHLYPNVGLTDEDESWLSVRR